MNGITPDKLAVLLLCYDTPRGNVAVKGMKSITSNYMLPPVEVDQLSRSSGGARGPKPTDSEVRVLPKNGEPMPRSCSFTVRKA